MTWKCDNCGAHNPDATKWCRVCGAMRPGGLSMNGTTRKYACPVCGRLYDTEAEAAWCAKKHTARDIAHAEVTELLGELAQYLRPDVGGPYNNE